MNPKQSNYRRLGNVGLDVSRTYTLLTRTLIGAAPVSCVSRHYKLGYLSYNGQETGVLLTCFSNYFVSIFSKH